MTREALAATVGTVFLVAWAASYLWIRRAESGAEVLLRFAYMLYAPIVGVGATSVILNRAGVWPWLVCALLAGGVDVLAIMRLKR